MMNLKIYYMHNYNSEEWGNCIVAESFKEAKIIFHKTAECEGFLSIRGRIVNPIPPITTIKKGELNAWIGLFHSCYRWISENCPFCHKLVEFHLDEVSETICECPICHKQFTEIDLLAIKKGLK